MFLAPWKPKTTVFTGLFASGSKNHGICHVFWPGPRENTGIYAVFSMLQEERFSCQKAQKHCKFHYFYASIAPKKHEKSTKNQPKIAQKGPPKRILEFYHRFFPLRTPKTCKPHQPEGFWGRVGGSGAPPGS